jgi:hypothetical protein
MTVMTTKPLGTIGRLAMFFLPVVPVCAGFLIAIHLLHPRPAVVNVLAAATTFLVLAYALFMARQEARSWDEVQRAGAGFANSSGWVWGGFATLFLLAIPPIMNRAVDAVMELPGAARSTDIHLGVRLGLTLGATLVMVMQALAIIVASFIWRRRMRGPGERS